MSVLGIATRVEMDADLASAVLPIGVELNAIQAAQKANQTAVLAAIAALVSQVSAISAKVDKLMATLDDVRAAVAAERTVEDSVVTLLEGIAQQLAVAMASNDPVAMQTVVDDINANASRMAAAVAANTAPPAPPPPAPTP